MMAKSTTILLLPPSIRHRLTLRSALLSDPRRYFKNVLNAKSNPVPKTKTKNRRSKIVTVTEETQTDRINQMNISTKMKEFVRGQSTKKLRASKFRAWVKRAKVTTSSFMLEPRELRGILKPDRFLKNSLGELKFTERKPSKINRILKKRVKVEKKPMISYISKELISDESLCSPGNVSEDKPADDVVPADNDIKSSTTFTSASSVATESSEALSHHSLNLERKSARCVLERALSTHSSLRSGAGVIVLYPMSKIHQPEKWPSLPSLMKPDKLHSPPLLKLPPKRIPKERLYFKNVFSNFPGMR